MYIFYKIESIGRASKLIVLILYLIILFRINTIYNINEHLLSNIYEHKYKEKITIAIVDKLV